MNILDQCIARITKERTTVENDGAPVFNLGDHDMKLDSITKVQKFDEFLMTNEENEKAFVCTIVLNVKMKK